MGNILHPVDISKSYTLYIPSTFFQPQQESVDSLLYTGRSIKPLLVDNDAYAFGCLSHIPIGAIISGITFYGYTVNATSILCYYVYEYDDITTGPEAMSGMWTSGDLTGAIGDKNGTWTPVGGHVITDKKPLMLGVKLHGVTFASNAQFKGVLVNNSFV